MRVRLEFDGRWGDAEVNEDILSVMSGVEEKAKAIARELEPFIEAMLALEKVDSTRDDQER